MDCVDCHNRPTHIFHTPGQDVDAALEEGRIDPALPYIRREGLKALQAGYPSQEEARAGIASAIKKFYATSYPDVAAKRSDAVTAAGQELGSIWCWNVFPEMNVTWGTYTSNIGHPDMSTTVGCFRCHGGEQMTEDGSMIPMDCTLCHALLAEREENPKILQTVPE
jgi:hypothetical protein